MKKNVGAIDRIIRFVLGIGILLIGVICESWWGAIGIIPIATGLLRVCPAYLPFKINTCKKD